MMYKALLFVFFGMIALSSCKKAKEDNPISRNYLNIPCCNPNSSINILIEIPSGTTAKYEFNKKKQILEIDSVNGKPRYIDYLAYPANYGMVLNTMLKRSEGGDGDPLDVVVLGSQLERSSVVQAKVIGGIQLKDNGENDDKLIAIPLNSSWSDVSSLEDLKNEYPGALDILIIFFKNYKGTGQMEFLGEWTADEALALVDAARITNDDIEK